MSKPFDWCEKELGIRVTIAHTEEQFEPGDHVAWQGRNGYYRTGVVEKVRGNEVVIREGVNSIAVPISRVLPD